MVLTDTGYWLALANARDRWHEAAVAASRRLDETLVVTWPVVTETCYLMLTRLGVQAELRFVEQLSRNVSIHEIGQEHLGDIRALMEQYARLPMDLADASLVPRGNSAWGRVAFSPRTGATSTPIVGRTQNRFHNLLETRD